MTPHATPTTPPRPESHPAWLPGQSFEPLRQRAALLKAIRAFFDAHGYLEVETPLLSPDIVVDTHLEPFSTIWRDDPRAATGVELFLQTSPEFSHKRLLAAGIGPIFEVFRAFRNGESGSRHNPEFTLLEWYRPGDDHFAQMTFTEALVRHALQSAGHTLDAAPFERLTYDAAFERHLGTRVLHLPTADLAQLARNQNLSIPPGMTESEQDRDDWLNLLLAECVEPRLGRAHPQFLHDYPASQAALAIIRPGSPPVAERFELYWDGVELCNGYHELRDPAELRRRNAIQNQNRLALGLRALPSESRLLRAMEEGLPPCSGVALGFERLLMRLYDWPTIDRARAFLTEKPL